uniref:G2/mitotic-specific cyclin-B3 n=1 Tax=Laticauda laticaudata TaxID=8630 RepID=A0A8C5T1C2_LATLA
MATAFSPAPGLAAAGPMMSALYKCRNFQIRIRRRSSRSSKKRRLRLQVRFGGPEGAASAGGSPSRAAGPRISSLSPSLPCCSPATGGPRLPGCPLRATPRARPASRPVPAEEQRWKMGQRTRRFLRRNDPPHHPRGHPGSDRPLAISPTSLDKAPSEDSPAKLSHLANRGLGEEQVNPLVVVVVPAAQVAPAEDIDLGQLDDPYANAEYAKDIFEYMQEREKSFLLPDYMKSQPDITMDMRAILVDWMVEVQENFELTHETLYLAVKVMDHYLVQVAAMRDKLQLIGSTAILIASKFEERCPPCLDDFLYICDDAYQREELLAMERGILQTLHFDINIPIAYRFLRRFAKCARATMETLTLARFICELTLQDYAFVQEGASRLAASCLLLALRMKNLRGWVRIPALPGIMSPREKCGQGGGSRQPHALQKGSAFPWWQRWAGGSWGEETGWAGKKGEQHLGWGPLLLAAKVPCPFHTCAWSSLPAPAAH